MAIAEQGGVGVVGHIAVQRELDADLVAERVEPLRLDDSVAAAPADHEATVRQRHDAGVVLLPRCGGIDQDVGGKGAAAVGQDRRPDVGRAGAVRVGPHHDEAAV